MGVGEGNDSSGSSSTSAGPLGVTPVSRVVEAGPVDLQAVADLQPDYGRVPTGIELSLPPVVELLGIVIDPVGGIVGKGSRSS